MVKQVCISHAGAWERGKRKSVGTRDFEHLPAISCKKKGYWSMNNRIGFKLISMIVATIFCLQGCIWKTISVDEQMRELSRKPAEIGRKYKIVLGSLSSVMVYEEVKMGNEVTYEVIDVKRKGRATGRDIVEDILIGRLIMFPILVVGTAGLGLVAVLNEDFWYLGLVKNALSQKDLCPCPGPGCPIEKTVTEHKGTTIKHENINYKEITVSFVDVAVYINGKHRTNIPINSDGIAEFNFGLYPLDLKGIDEVEVKYKYKEAVASTSIPNNIYAVKTYLNLAPEAPNAKAAKYQIYKWEFAMEKGIKGL